MASVEDIKGFTAARHHKVLATIIMGETGVSSAGFPTISEPSFQAWMEKVPHLFAEGCALLDFLQGLETQIRARPDAAEAPCVSWLRAIKVLETVIQTAAVTAPTDLWLMKHVLSSWQRVGLLERLKSGTELSLGELSAGEGMNLQQLRYDFHFLKSRAVVVDAGEDRYRLGAAVQVKNLVQGFQAVDSDLPVNFVPLLLRCLARESITALEREQLTRFLTLPTGLTAAPNWIPGPAEVELGYRLVPLLLALRKSPRDPVQKLIPDAVAGAELMNHVLTQAGLIKSTGEATALGQRVLDRGPGPFGIIHAYHEYMKQHEDLLRGRKGHRWVSRAENVAASQDANRKTFLMINDSMDRFIATVGYQLEVFIEHAVGQGEATRQRLSRSGEASIEYFGADLEDAAIDRALDAQKRGELPARMRFVRKADIGEPSFLIDTLAGWGIDVEGAVMVVGNGFHEIRSQNNEKMIGVFKAYNEAGILLIFTEESALSDDDLIHTGWNTYHAGFRFVHEISGQGLRPAYEYDKETDRLSWKACLEKAGYWVHPGFTSQTRRIYPVPRAQGYNPAISVNYFCIPTWLAGRVRSAQDSGRKA